MPNRITNFGVRQHNNIGFYKTLLFLLLLCGYDYNIFNRSNITKLVVKLYCIVIVLVTIYATTYCCIHHELPQIWSLIEYCTSVSVILCFKSQMCTFLNKLHNVDIFLRIHRKHYRFEKLKFFLITATVLLTRIIYTYLSCYTDDCYRVLVFFLISNYSLLALDVNRIWRCVIYDVIRYRLKVLRKRMEETPNVDYYLYVKDKKAVKEKKIRFSLFLYRSIADLLDIVSPELSASLFLSVACSLPKLVANVYHLLLIIEDHEPYESLGFVIIHTVQVTFLLFTPFFIVEFYSVEVERIRLFLMHRLIDEPDSTMKEDIQLFLNYTQIRSFRHRIWRIIPVSLSLPLELVNLCINYVIVLINFTHLYG